MSLDGFLGDTSDDEVRHRRPTSHRVPPGRRKTEKVGNYDIYFGLICPLCVAVTVFIKAANHYVVGEKRKNLLWRVLSGTVGGVSGFNLD